MLIPITRAKFEELIPRFATGEQYRYAWGKLPDFLRRLLISVVGLLFAFFLRAILPESFAILEFLIGIVAGLYWLWSPVYWASRKNLAIRRYPYAGFLQGEVLDAYPTEEVIGTEETVNKRGELVIIENRERQLNLEVGDEEGFTTFVQVPLQRSHRSIRPGDRAELLVLSYRPDLSRIDEVSDVYLADYDLWVSDYPFLRRDVFVDMSRRIIQEFSPPPPPPRRRRSKSNRR